MRWLLTLLLLLVSTQAFASRLRVAVVLSDDLAAYQAPVPAFLAEVGLSPAPAVFNIHGRESEAREVVARLEQDRPEVVFCVGAKAAFAMKNGLPNTPIVYASVLDPERYGIEGRQVTGVTMRVPPVTYLSQLVGFFPDVRSIGVLRGQGIDDERIAELRAAAAELGLTLLVERVAAPREARKAFMRLVDKRVDALWLPPDRQILSRDAFRGLADETRRRRLPLLVDTDNMVQAGGLFSVVPDPDAVGRQAASLVRQILDGAAPAVLEPENPNNLLVVLNTRTLDQASIKFDPLLRDFVDVLID